MYEIDNYICRFQFINIAVSLDFNQFFTNDLKNILEDGGKSDLVT